MEGTRHAACQIQCGCAGELANGGDDDKQHHLLGHAGTQSWAIRGGAEGPSLDEARAARLPSLPRGNHDHLLEVVEDEDNGQDPIAQKYRHDIGLSVEGNICYPKKVGLFWSGHPPDDTDSCELSPCVARDIEVVMTGNGIGVEDRVIDALFAKLETNSFASLTVSEIAAAAGISRKTFYRHFSGKTAVARRYLEGLMSGLVDEDEQIGDMSFAEGIRHYFVYFQNQTPRLRLLRSNGLLDLALPIQNEVFARRFPRLNLPWHDPNLGEERLADLFVVGGLWNVLTDSLDTNPPIAPTRLAATLMSQVSKRTGKLR